MKLRIEKMVYGGSGLARPTESSEAERTVFVPFTLPGELVEARPLESKGAFAEAELVQVVEASSDRVTPGCVHFGECGGCQYQHARYNAQLEFKTAVLRETLQRAGLADLPEIQVHADEPWGYRNRIRLRVAEVEGALRVGYIRRGTNEFLPVRMCPIAAPVLWRAAMAFLKVAENAATSPWAREAAEVEFFTTGDESKLQMTVFTRQRRAANLSGFGKFCEQLRELLPELTGAGVMLLGKEGSQPSRRAERPRPIAAWGAEGLSYSAAGEKYWVSRGGFFPGKPLSRKRAGSNRNGRPAWDTRLGFICRRGIVFSGFESSLR